MVTTTILSYSEETIKEFNGFNSIQYRKEHDIKYGASLEEANRFDTNGIRICHQCYMVYRKLQTSSQEQHKCSVKKAK